MLYGSPPYWALCELTKIKVIRTARPMPRIMAIQTLTLRGEPSLRKNLVRAGEAGSAEMPRLGCGECKKAMILLEWIPHSIALASDGITVAYSP